MEKSWRVKYFESYCICLESIEFVWEDGNELTLDWRFCDAPPFCSDPAEMSASTCEHFTICWRLQRCWLSSMSMSAGKEKIAASLLRLLWCEKFARNFEACFDIWELGFFVFVTLDRWENVLEIVAEISLFCTMMEKLSCERICSIVQDIKSNVI